MTDSGPQPLTAQPHYSEEGAEAPAVPNLLPYGAILPEQRLDGGEIVILALKPSLWFLVLVCLPWLLAAAAVMIVVPRTVDLSGGSYHRLLLQVVFVITAARLVIALLQWSSRLFVLTNRRVMCYRGLAQVSLFEVPLVQIRNTYVHRRRFEKPFNVGSIGFSLSGAHKVDAWWEHINDPEEIHRKIRRAIEKALDQHPL